MAKSSKDDDRDDVLAEVSGASVTILWHGYQWSYWGSARMMMTATRVIERTKFFVSERQTAVPLSQVTGVTMLKTPNPILLVLGFITLPLLGLGLIFLILALFQKHTYLVVTAPNCVLVIGCKGKIQNYEDFMLDILDEVDRVRKSSGGGSGGSMIAPPSAPRGMGSASAGPGQERVTSSPKGGQPMVTCGECGAEYRIPAGSAGKKFKCQKCQAIISVPEDF
jgi:hypothetical protein